MSKSGSRAAYIDDLATRAWELMHDGQWHDRELIARELMKMVPPGPAMRRAEYTRARMKGPNTAAPVRRVRPREAHELIAIGQRSIVTDYFHQKIFEMTPPPSGSSLANPQPGQRQVRMLWEPRLVRGKQRRSTYHDPERERAQVEAKVLRAYVEALQATLTRLGLTGELEQLRAEHGIDDLSPPL